MKKQKTKPDSKLLAEVKAMIKKMSPPVRRKRKPCIKWKRLGRISVDSGTVGITDLCYTLGHDAPERKERPEFSYDDIRKRMTGKNRWQDPEFVSMPFRKGHEGAGVIVHSPGGDGWFDVWGLLDEYGAVRAVHLSFDGVRPENYPAGSSTARKYGK